MQFIKSFANSETVQRPKEFISYLPTYRSRYTKVVKSKMYYFVFDLYILNQCKNKDILKQITL